MSDVKRYDAVHIRYEENNIRYGEGCEVEMVTASDYDACASRLHEVAVACANAEQERDTLRALLAGVCDYADGLLCEVNSAWAYGGSTGPNAVHEDADYLAARAALEIKP